MPKRFCQNLKHWTTGPLDREGGAIIIIAASNYTKCTLQRDCFETHTVPSIARECKMGDILSPSLARYIIQYRCVTVLQTRDFEELRKYDTT
ncbi:hypothetical protein BH23CHL4_BH23CHL4_01570 [soil metagenome]